MIAFKGGAGEPSDMRLPGKAGGAVAVRRTLASTICWITGPTQVPRPRQLRDASTVMRFRPAHQSVINRHHDDRASCPARQNLEQALERKPRTRLPATWNGGHESGPSASNRPLSLHAPIRTLRRGGSIHRAKLHRSDGSNAGWAPIDDAESWLGGCEW